MLLDHLIIARQRLQKRWAKIYQPTQPGEYQLAATKVIAKNLFAS